jgi:hypothetical protein
MANRVAPYDVEGEKATPPKGRRVPAVSRRRVRPLADREVPGLHNTVVWGRSRVEWVNSG